MKKFAVIDIGSNSVRLMIVADGNVLYKALQTTRLGEGLAEKPILKAEAITRTVNAVAGFYNRAKAEGAEGVYAFATAAVRSAENRQLFLDGVKSACGLTVEVISGEKEAEIGILGALGNVDGGVIDIGGASTEIVVRKAGRLIYKKSVNIGVVRLKDLCGQDLVRLQTQCDSVIKQFEDVPQDVCFYGIGGTATTLAAQHLGLEEYTSEKITGASITEEDLSTLLDKLTVMKIEEMENLPCMPKGRADVIIGGAVWLKTIIAKLQLGKIITSDRDNLEGYAIQKGLLE